jgi:hypothetical protein
MDGDSTSMVSYGSGLSTLVSDKSRVYKGGSWDDRAYWLGPGTRRYMDEDQSASTVGLPRESRISRELMALIVAEVLT